MADAERYKVAEAVMLDRNNFSADYEALINAMKEKESETAALLLPQFENVEGNLKSPSRLYQTININFH